MDWYKIFYTPLNAFYNWNTFLYTRIKFTSVALGTKFSKLSYIEKILVILRLTLLFDYFSPNRYFVNFFFKTTLSSSTIWRIVKRHKFVPAMCIFVPKENYWEFFKGFWSDLLLANYQVYYDPTLNNAQLTSVSWFLPVLHTFSIEKKLCETGLCPGEIMNLISKDYIIIHD